MRNVSSADGKCESGQKTMPAYKCLVNWQILQNPPQLVAECLTFSGEEGLISSGPRRKEKEKEAEERLRHGETDQQPSRDLNSGSQSSQASQHYKTLDMIQNIPSETFSKYETKRLREDTDVLIMSSVVLPAAPPAITCHLALLSVNKLGALRAT